MPMEVSAGSKLGLCSSTRRLMLMWIGMVCCMCYVKQVSAAGPDSDSHAAWASCCYCHIGGKRSLHVGT